MSASDSQPFRAIAATLDRIDVAVYEAAQRDPLEPIIGLGPRAAAVCCFGRDPGRHEVVHGQPFVGVGGQKIRAGLWRAARGTELPSFEHSLEIGASVFWANTVPYKPLGNKAWPMKTVRAFRPLMADTLLNAWSGTHVLAFGLKATEWFGLHDREIRAQIKAHLAQPHRYEKPFSVVLHGTNGVQRGLHIHALPHPSPLNATWAPHFPRLLDSALTRIAWQGDLTV